VSISFQFTVYVMLLCDGQKCTNCIACSLGQPFGWFTHIECLFLLILHTCMN